MPLPGGLIHAIAFHVERVARWALVAHLNAMNTHLFIAFVVGPDFGAVGASGRLSGVVGALLTYGLITSVLMVIICAATWALGSAHGSWQASTRGKVGLFVALGGALLTGSALVWTNWLLGIGAHL